MKARVYVSFKDTVLDPQGKTVCAALQGLGYEEITDVRQGKYFEISIRPGADPRRVEQRITEAAQDVLANPVIEDFRVVVEP
ncbi:MAG: phosphoribosylformylglycinamidine synthase subunit PurS [Bryobacteraceae bacterium]|nr:phosphoribosylformylglycinamidine synthase subunit PurS [Bryobacteraceae bacterium]